MPAPPSTIRKRADFLAANRGLRVARPGFVLLAHPNGGRGKRFGITVTKKVGNAVVRNRMKRRFRELLRAALPERGLADHDHVLIGRDGGIERDFTALSAELDEALARGRAFRDAGADMVFVESPLNDTELAAVPREVTDVPLIANMVEGGKTPYRDAAALGGLGFAMAIFPITNLLAATRAMETMLAGLRRDGKADTSAIAGFADMHEISGLADYLAHDEAAAKGDAA